MNASFRINVNNVTGGGSNENSSIPKSNMSNLMGES